MISKFKNYDSEFTKVDVILEKSIAIDVQASTIKASQQEIKSKNVECHKLLFLNENTDTNLTLDTKFLKLCLHAESNFSFQHSNGFNQ